MNDKELLGLLKKDPEKGLAAVIDEYGGYVLKIARTKLGGICSKEDIEEAVSDIFFKLYTSCKDTNGDIRSVRGFLSVIAERHCIDIFRVRCSDAETLDYSELENIIADSGGTSGFDLVWAIKQLGEPDSSIFIRKYYFGQKNSDIAKELGMKPNVLNTRVSRGLDKLRKILEEGM